MKNAKLDHRSDIVFAVALLLLCYLCWLVRSTLLLVYVSVVFAVVFTPAVTWIRKLRIRNWQPGRGTAVLLLIGMVLLPVAGLLLLVIPSIASDVQGLSNELPERLRHVRGDIARLPYGDRLAAMVHPGSIESHVAGLLQRGFDSVKAVAGGVANLLLLLLLTAYFIIDGDRSFRWVMSLVPRGNRTRLTRTLEVAATRMQKWLTGQALLMLILGTSSFIVFWAAGVRYSVALALLAAVANFVPIVGPLVSVLIAGFVAAMDSWTKLLAVLVFYVIYQQVESSFLTPRIMKSTVELPAVAVVVALALGASLAGIAGAIVAVPTCALVATILNEYASDHEEDVSEPAAA